AQPDDPENFDTTVKFERDPNATWGPSTSGRLLAMRIGIHIERTARLTPESAAVDLLIQNVDSEAESVTGVEPELMFAIRMTPLPGTSAERNSVPLKAEFMRSAPRTPMGFSGGTLLPAKFAIRYKVELAKWFDLKNPGSYEVRVCYSPTVDISEGYDFEKRCHLGVPEVTTVIHLIPAVYGDPKQDEKGKSKQ